TKEQAPPVALSAAKLSPSVAVWRNFRNASPRCPTSSCRACSSNTSPTQRARREAVNGAEVTLRSPSRPTTLSTMNLHLLQISDSALPIGGFAHSWGLEAARARGLVHDAESLERWARNWLVCSLAPLEGVVVASVCRAVAANDWPVVRRANE